MNRLQITVTLLLLISACGGGDEAPRAGATNEPVDSAKEEPLIPDAVLKEKLFGSWQVTYEDESLAYVFGTATLDPAVGTAELMLTASAGGEPVRLQAKSVAITDSKLVITLPPGSPRSQSDYEPAGTPQEVGKAVRLSLGDGNLDFELGKPEPATGEVVITLSYDAQNDVLAGQWVQEVDAQTGAVPGGGRQGFFRYGDAAKGGGEMTGREIWQRPRPRIKGTFAIGDQFSTSLTGPKWRYPFVVGTAEPAQRGVDERYLMIIGKNLPRNIRESIEIESADEDLYYRVYRTMDSYKGLPEGDSIWRDLAFGYLERLKAVGKLPIERNDDDDFLILHVRLKPGVQPGSKTFRLNGVETEWLLRFGDHRVDMGFARDLKLGIRAESIEKKDLDVDTEFSDFVYQGEQVYFEIRSRSRLPMNSLQFFISRNGEPLLFDGYRELTALPVDGNVETYRSEPIYLIRPGTRHHYPADALTIDVTGSDRLQVAMTESILLASPAFVDTAVLESPKELRRAIRGQPAPDGLLWTDAVLRSAQCGFEKQLTDTVIGALTNPANLAGSGIQQIERISTLARDIAAGNVRELTRDEAEAFVDYAPSEWGRAVAAALFGGTSQFRMETSIKIGEHAAMLIIRQVLVDLLRGQLPLYAGAMSDAEIDDFREMLRPHIMYDPQIQNVNLGELGINKVKIAAPDGHPWALEMSYLPDLLRTDYKLESDAARARYEIAATREARRKFADAIRGTIAMAEEIDDCDVYELLELTGVGMSGVVAQAKAAFMIRSPNKNGRGSWVADWPAQVRVGNVARAWEILEIQEKISDASWSDAYLALSIAAIPVTNLAAGTRAAAVALSASRVTKGIELAVALSDEVRQQWHEERELDFAIGASAIIGTSRYNAANAADSSAVNILLVVAEMLFEGYKTVEAWNELGNVATIAAADRGKALIAGLHDEALENMIKAVPEQALSMAQFHDIAAGVNQSLWLEQTIGREAMNPDEIETLDFVDRLVALREARPTPAWAEGFDAATLALLDNMVHRADVARIGEHDPGALAQVVRDETGFRVLHRPLTTLEELTNSINNIKRSPPSRGPRFLAQAAEPEYWNVERRMNEEGFVLHSNRLNNRVVLDAYEGRDGDHRIFRVERQRVPDRVLGSGKDLVRLDRSVWQLDLTQGGGTGAERNILAMKIRYRDDEPGVPVRLVAELRALQILGFDYADPMLGGFVLPNARDARLLGEMHWIRTQEPELGIDDAFRQTTAMDQIEALAVQLGFRVGAIRIVDAYAHSVDPWSAEWQPRAPLKHLTTRQWFQVQGSSEWTMARDEFLESHSLPAADANTADPKVPYGYDIYLELIPAS